MLNKTEWEPHISQGGKYVFVPVWNVDQELTVFQLTLGAQYMSVSQFNKQENC